MTPKVKRQRDENMEPNRRGIYGMQSMPWCFRFFGFMFFFFTCFVFAFNDRLTRLWFYDFIAFENMSSWWPHDFWWMIFEDETLMMTTMVMMILSPWSGYFSRAVLNSVSSRKALCYQHQPFQVGKSSSNSSYLEFISWIQLGRFRYFNMTSVYFE